MITILKHSFAAPGACFSGFIRLFTTLNKDFFQRNRLHLKDWEMETQRKRLWGKLHGIK